MKNFRQFALLIILVIPLAAPAQTTEITYQGSIKDGGVASTGTYDLEFRLFAADAGGTAIETKQQLAVGVINGVFSVRLNFLMVNFIAPGQDRYLEIAVRPAGGGAFQTLSPRQRVTFTPYSFRSINADVASDAMKLGGVPAGQYVLTGDARLSDARNPLPGSANYIQNSTTQQAASNFNINGNGTASVFNASQYNIGGNRFLATSFFNENVFVGVNAGPVNTGASNSFVGNRAGLSNTSGSLNSFFGKNAGAENTTGGENSFFGFNAGIANTTASNNSFFGSNAGGSNTTGYENAFFGTGAGQANTTTGANSFFGYRAGFSNTNAPNAFFGWKAGESNTTGPWNSFFGPQAGRVNTTGFSNTFIGTSAGLTNTTGNNNTAIGYQADVASSNLEFATALGSYATVSTSNTIALGRSDGSDTVVVPGKLEIGTLGVAGATALCLNSSNRIGTCSSSLRYKSNIASFTSGLELISRLRPISFTWKDGGMRDLGLGAEDLAKVEPLLVTRNRNGELEGVKYDRIGVVLINAVKEQQVQIESQQTLLAEQKETIKRQQAEIDALKAHICTQSPSAAFCKPGN